MDGFFRGIIRKGKRIKPVRKTRREPSEKSRRDLPAESFKKGGL